MHEPPWFGRFAPLLIAFITVCESPPCRAVESKTLRAENLRLASNHIMPGIVQARSLKASWGRRLSRSLDLLSWPPTTLGVSARARRRAV